MNLFGLIHELKLGLHKISLEHLQNLKVHEKAHVLTTNTKIKLIEDTVFDTKPRWFTLFFLIRDKISILT